METIKSPTILAALLLSSTLLGCSTEPRACSLDPASPDPAIARCADDDRATCVVETHPQCDGALCVKMGERDGFCTVPCTTDAQCGEFESCVELVLASGERQCVPDDYL